MSDYELTCIVEIPKGSRNKYEYDPGWNSLEDVEDLPRQLRAEIGHFFSVYKDLDADRHSEVGGWAGRDAALETIDKARRAFAEKS